MLLFPSDTEHEEMRLRESKANQKRSVCGTVQPMFLINVSPQVFVKQMRKTQTGHWIGQTSSEGQSNVRKSDVAVGVSQTLLSHSSPLPHAAARPIRCITGAETLPLISHGMNMQT